MKIPETIQVGPYTFKIEKLKNLWIEHDTRGQFKPTAKKIVLDADIEKEYLSEVFLHEVLEAINWTYDLKLSHGEINFIGLGFAQALELGKL